MSPISRRVAHVVISCGVLLSASLWGWRGSAAPQSAPSDGLDPTLLATYKWRSVGPDRGGRSITITGVKGRPNEAYFGATGGGLWKTTDRGVTWAPVTDGQIRSSSVGAVAVAESNPDVVFIGMGESCIRGNVMEGDGVYKSADAGKTWTHLDFPDARVISKIRIHPTNPDIVYVAAFGRLSLPSDARGIYKSTDGGKTWKRTLFRDDKTAAVDLSIDRHNPSVMYAALWEAYRLEYTMSSGGPGSGLFKSTDGGETWTEITRNPGLPAGVDGKIGVSISGADPNRVYALVENEHGGVFRSDDAGATWTLTYDGRNLRQRAFYYTHITADPHNKDLVYAQDVGTFRSTDGGKSFQQFAGSDSHDIWIDPDDSNHFLYANDGGGQISYNALSPQVTFSARDYPTGQFYHVVATAHVPYHVCGAQQDSSTICVPSDTGLAAAGFGRGGGGGGGGRGGRGAEPATYGAGGSEDGYIAADPKDPDIFFAGGNNGTFMTRLNRRTGEVREVGPYPRMFSGEPSSDLVERIQWTYPIIFSTVDPTVLYTGTQHVWKTTTAGQTWERISPDLSRHDPKTMGDSGGPITHDMNSPEVYGTVFAIGPGKRDVNVIWAGSDDGFVQVTQTGGKTWTNVTPKDMPDLGRVSIIDASSFDSASAYVAVKRPLLGDMAPYIFRTHDYGKTWTKIVSGLSPLDYVHVVREDPQRKGLLYAGTQHGVYYSYDDGDHWMSLSLNLPDTPIADLIVSGHDLAIATHGRGFYILDDVSLLRQFTPAVTSAPDVYLFAPNDAIRSAGGATIKYWIKRPVQGLTIDVLDPKGTVVRAFTSDAAPGGRGGGRGNCGPEGAAPAADARGVTPGDAAAATPDQAGAPAGRAGRGGGGRGGGRGGAGGPGVATGINTVTWDLRYPDATSFPCMVLWGGSVTGPLAAPGRYQVRLTANGQTQTQSFTVRRHPLYSDVTDADLQAQFDLAIQVRDKLSEANSAVIQIRALKSQIDDRLSKSSDEALKETGGTLRKHLSDVEEAIYQVRNQSNQDPLNFPIKINNRLASLLSMVDHGDGRPIGNAPVVFRDLTAELKAQTDKLAAALAKEMLSFNTEAKRLNLEPIK
jgi:photosystem II stability/assembly factor-like uncharacterized protein